MAPTGSISVAMELPNPVIIGIWNFLKTFNLGSFENYIYIMQEAKKSLSSLNLVFFLPTLQVTIMGQYCIIK